MSLSSVTPSIQRQSRVERRIHEQMDSAEESRNSTDLPEKTAHLSESTASVKAKRRQGVSDLHIPPLALFSLGTLGRADPDWQFTHCASDSESGDGEDEVFEFPRPPKSGLEVSAFFSRYSHSPHSSVDSTSTSGSWYLHSECSSPTSSGPPVTPTSPAIRPLSIKKRNTAMGPLPSPGRFASSGPSLPRSAILSSPPPASFLPPRSPSLPSSPSTPSPSPRRTVKSEEQAAADDEFYAVQARGFVTLAQSESTRKSGVIPIFPSTSTSTSTAQNVPMRPRRPPLPPPPPLVDAAPCSFSPSAASTSAPSSHLRNSHVHTNSASYPRARIAPSDAHARPRSSSTSTSSSYSSYSTSSTTGQAAPSSVCFPSSYVALATASRARPPSTSRPRTGLVPNFSRPTSLGLGLLIPPSAAAAALVSPQSAYLAPRELESGYNPELGYMRGVDTRRSSGEGEGEQDCTGAGADGVGDVDLANFDFAADYAAYAPLLQTPTPSPSVGMGYGIGIGATAPWGAHVHGDDENEWVAYTEETEYIEGGGDEQQQELSPLVAPAPSPAPLSESESEYSSDEGGNDEGHVGDWRPLASAPASGSGSSCSSLSHGAPLLAPPPPQPPRLPAEPAHPTPALRSRWSSSTISSLHSTHGHARAPKTFSFGRYLPRTRPTAKPKPKPSVTRPAPRPMGSVTVLPPPPRRLRAPAQGDYAESSRSSSGSESAGWSYAAAIAQRSVASSPPSAAGHHSAQSSVSGHSARGSVSLR